MTQKIFFIVGEPSGDLLGGRLMTALAQQQPHLTMMGVGGSRMEAANTGFKSLFPMSDLTLFGIAELLPKLPLILRRLKETTEAIKREKPDLVVSIDAPDFSFRIAKRLKGMGIPCVHYVAPTVWAWRPKRALKIKPLFQHLLALFPFEPPYFEKVGLPCTFAGHPLLEAGIDKASAEQFFVQHPAIKADAPLLVLLAGSRQSELKMLLPVFEQTVANLKQALPQLQIVMPTLAHLQPKLAVLTEKWAIKPYFVTSDADKYNAFKAGTAALAASGTIALELGLAGTPSVIAYKINKITAALFRRLMLVKYVSLVNIMANKMVMPELLQEQCTADNLTAACLNLLTHEDARQAQKTTLSQVQAWLTPEGALRPSDKAAEVILSLLNKG